MTQLESLVLYHPGGYGGTARSECVLANGAALATDWRQDNSGPHSAAEVRAVYKTVAGEFPDAAVFASTFDRFVYPWPGLVFGQFALRAAPHVAANELGGQWCALCDAD